MSLVNDAGTYIYDKYANLPEHITEVGLVLIDDWNINGCPGDHLPTTGGVGAIKIPRFNHRPQKQGKGVVSRDAACVALMDPRLLSSVCARRTRVHRGDQPWHDADRVVFLFIVVLQEQSWREEGGRRGSGEEALALRRRAQGLGCHHPGLPGQGAQTCSSSSSAKACSTHLCAWPQLYKELEGNKEALDAVKEKEKKLVESVSHSLERFASLRCAHSILTPYLRTFSCRFISTLSMMRNAAYTAGFTSHAPQV